MLADNCTITLLYFASFVNNFEKFEHKIASVAAPTDILFKKKYFSDN